MTAALGGCTGTDAGTAGGGSTGGSTTSTPSPGGSSDFVSDNPQGGAAGNAKGAADGAAAPAAGAGHDSNSDQNAAANRAIAEADIIQVSGGTLYALSQYSGLSVIDISAKDHLKILGRWQSLGVPFEMYLRGNMVYAMFTSWGQYLYDANADAYQWVTTSRIEALDVSNPAAIQRVGTFDMPGEISDSRTVGDVLYAVTYEDGACWNCQPKPNTTITSLAVGDPKAIHVVDQLSYTNPDPYGYGWWRRSITVTPQRMYVAGIEWDGKGDGHSTIQVVDISDPGGKLVPGAAVQAAGQIESRWQMDETNGVLRVVSQPGIWWQNGTPVVQTFTVASSNDVKPLGSLTLSLPQPERLQSARFDGNRAYAVTAVQHDPLFTIDLSDPKSPKQAGSIEMPGFIYYTEPRGDRLYTVGFEQGNPEGSLAVSLFDVSNLAAPAMLERVHFGGDWSNLAEDQDRIHKAFTFVDDLGLLMVPFTAYSYDQKANYGCSSYQSGIQLIDFGKDTLAKRGVAPAKGWARRAFVHDDRLFGVSDSEVGTFDISDRDAPKQTASLPIATNVTQSVVVGDTIARLASDWWSGSARLDLVPLADPARIEPLGSLDLSSLSPQADTCWGWGYYVSNAFAMGQSVVLVRAGWDYASQQPTTSLDVIDLSDVAHPKPTGHVDLAFNPYSYGWWYGDASSGDTAVLLGTTLVLRTIENPIYYDPAHPGTPEHASLELVDLANPAKPVHTTFAVPDGYGHTNLIADGHDVLLSHWVPDAKDPYKVRFYVDRVDVSDSAKPVLTSSVNVPGALISVDGPSGRVLTLDYKRVEVDSVLAQDCYAAFGYGAEWMPADANNPDWQAPGTCYGLHRTFKLLDVDAGQATLRSVSDLADGAWLGNLLLGDDRVFAVQNAGYYGMGPSAGGDAAAPAGGVGTKDAAADLAVGRLIALGGMRDGELKQATRKLAPNEWVYAAATIGKKAITTGYSSPALGVFDTTDLDAPKYGVVEELPSWVSNVTVSGDLAICSMSFWGVQTIDVSKN
jgi:hypothetical protein